MYEGTGPVPATLGELRARIDSYLQTGGLFNPEMAIHERVRELLIDCRAALASSEQAAPATSTELRAEIFRGLLKALEVHIAEWPHLGDCEWQCTTTGPLHELIRKVREQAAPSALAMREALEKMLSPQFDWYDGEMGVGHKYRALARAALERSGLPGKGTT